MNRRAIVLMSVLGLAAAGAVGSQLVSGAGESDESVFISVTPCRLIDTRSGSDNVGPRDTPIGPDATVSFEAYDGDDADSPCEIPASATAISTNAVAVAPTARGYLTLYPEGVPNPGTANINFVAGQAPTPNAAVIPLSPAGAFNAYNAFGEVNLVIDVNGYYQPSTNVGSTGPAGPQGEPGPANRISDEQIVLGDWGSDPGRPLVTDVDLARQMTFADGKVYVAEEFQGTIAVVDPETGNELKAVSVGGNTDGVTTDGTFVYAAVAATSEIAVIDPASDTVVDTISAPNAGTIAFAAGKLYVPTSNNKVHVVDVGTRAVSATVDVGASPYGIERVGDHVYVSNYLGGTVSVIATANDAVVDTITVGTNPNGIAFTGRHVYVANQGASSLSVVDPVEGKEIDTLTGFSNPTELAYDGRHLYVAQQDGTVGVVVVDVNNGEIVSQATEQLFAFYIAFDGTNVWVNADGDLHKMLPH